MSTDSVFSPMAFPILRNASQQRAEEQGQARGYAAGYAAGLRAAAQEVAESETRRGIEHGEMLQRTREQVEATTAALDAAAVALDGRTLPVLADAQDTLAEAAVELAEAILGYELEDGEKSARSALDRALTSVGPQAVHTVRLNPEDLSLLQEQGLHRDGVELVADRSVERGDAVGEFPDGYLDARIGTALSRAKTTLLGGPR